MTYLVELYVLWKNFTWTIETVEIQASEDTHPAALIGLAKSKLFSCLANNENLETVGSLASYGPKNVVEG